MKVSKAIEILEHFQKHHASKGYSDLVDALKLGIEALKRCSVLAQENPLWALQPLPGETPDDK